MTTSIDIGSFLLVWKVVSVNPDQIIYNRQHTMDPQNKISDQSSQLRLFKAIEDPWCVDKILYALTCVDARKIEEFLGNIEASVCRRQTRVYREASVYRIQPGLYRGQCIQKTGWGKKRG